MNSLGIVARACLMEAGRKKEQPESGYRKWGRRAAIGAGIGYGGLGVAGGLRGAYKMYGRGAKQMARGFGSGAVGAMRHPISAARGMGREGLTGISNAMRSGYTRAANFVDAHTPQSVKAAKLKVFGQRGSITPIDMGPGVKATRVELKVPGMVGDAKNYMKAKAKSAGGYLGDKFAAFKGHVGRHKMAYGIGAGLGAAGLGYAAYRAYKKRAKKAAREAYIATYMNLMEAAPQPEQESGFKKWGRRALYAGGAAAAGLGTLGAYRGYKNAKSGAKLAGMAHGAWGHLTNPLKVAKGAKKLLNRRYQKYMGTYNPTRVLAGQVPGYRGGQVDLSGIGQA